MSELAYTESTQSVNIDRTEAFNRCKIDLNFLASLAISTIFTSFFPPVYIALWGLLVEKCGIDNIFRLLLGLPRGHAKTTFIKLFVLFIILFTNRQFILIICASSPKAENFLADISDMLDEPNIIGVFGDWRAAIETDTKTLKKFSFMGRDIIIAATGQGSIRGINIKHRRPDVIVMDDAQDKENAESPVESHKMLTWLQSTVMKLRDPVRCFFLYIGNKYKVAPDCVCVFDKLEKNPLWIHVVTGAILEDGQPLWPELHSLDSLMEEFENDFNMGTPEIFLAEIMNDTEINLNALIDLTKVPFNPFEEEGEQVLCQGRCVIIDVATNKIGADDTVLGLHGVYPDAVSTNNTGVKVVLEMMEFGSLSPLATIQHALQMCFTHGANVIGVESTAYQSSLLFWFNHVCEELGIGQGLHFVELTPQGNKTKRILQYLKQLLRGEVYLALKCREPMFNEALSFKPAKTNNDDNKLDMASYWQQMIEKYQFLIALPHAVSNTDFEGAKVLGMEDNCPY